MTFVEKNEIAEKKHNGDGWCSPSSSRPRSQKFSTGERREGYARYTGDLF